MTKRKRRRFLWSAAALGAVGFVWWLLHGSAGGARLAMRLDATGLHAGGKVITAEEAVSLARVAGAGVDLVVTGDARQGDLDAVRTLFAQARILLAVKVAA